MTVKISELVERDWCRSTPAQSATLPSLKPRSDSAIRHDSDHVCAAEVVGGGGEKRGGGAGGRGAAEERATWCVCEGGEGGGTHGLCLGRPRSSAR